MPACCLTYSGRQGNFSHFWCQVRQNAKIEALTFLVAAKLHFFYSNFVIFFSQLMHVLCTRASSHPRFHFRYGIVNAFINFSVGMFVFLTCVVQLMIFPVSSLCKISPLSFLFVDTSLGRLVLMGHCLPFSLAALSTANGGYVVRPGCSICLPLVIDYFK